MVEGGREEDRKKIDEMERREKEMVGWRGCGRRGLLNLGYVGGGSKMERAKRWEVGVRTREGGQKGGSVGGEGTMGRWEMLSRRRGGRDDISVLQIVYYCIRLLEYKSLLCTITYYNIIM